MLQEFIIFDKRTGKVTGHFRTSTPDLLPNPPSPEFAFAPVTEEEHLESLRAKKRSDRLVGSVHGATITALRLEPRYRGKLVVNCDAKDMDNDGKPELAADGQSATRITVHLVDNEGTRIKEDSTTVRFSVTRGALSLRSVVAKAGSAVTELTSSTETVNTKLTALADGFEPGTLMVEFIPVQEFKEMSKAYRSKER